MLDQIPFETLGIGSGWFLVGVFVLLIYRGNLVPRSTHEDALHDRDEWRAESRIKDAQIAEQNKQLGHMAEVGQTVEAVMRAIQQPTARGGE